MKLNPIKLYKGAVGLYHLGEMAVHSPEVRAFVAKSVKRTAVRQVTNPKELAKNVALVASKPVKVAAVGWGVHEYNKEIDRLDRKPGAAPENAWQSPKLDALRTAAKMAGYGALLAVRSKNMLLASIYFGGANMDATGRTIARFTHAKDTMSGVKAALGMDTAPAPKAAEPAAPLPHQFEVANHAYKAMQQATSHTQQGWGDNARAMSAAVRAGKAKGKS
jgi:hypothetical protein